MNDNKFIASLCIVGLILISAMIYLPRPGVQKQAAPEINIDIKIDGKSLPSSNASQSEMGVAEDFEGGGLGTSHWTGNIEAGGTITATGNLLSSADLIAADGISYGGVEHDWIEGDCTDMTGTADGGVSTSSLFTIINPWGADAFIPEGGFIFEYTNGTTSVDISCGTTSSATLVADPDTENLVNDITVGTSTSVKFYNTSGTVTTADSGFTDPGTNSEDLILWESGKYIGCYAVESGGLTGGLLSPNSTASCSYKINSFR